MELLVKALKKTGKSIISSLTIEGKFECYILEDVDRGLNCDMRLDEILKEKIPGATAIPEGKYEVVITFSNKFKKYLPLLLNVPGYAGVRIHPGNFICDTAGCLLPGSTTGEDAVNNSRIAFNKLFAKLQSAETREKIYIIIQR